MPAVIFVYLLGFVEPMTQQRFVATSLEWVPSYGLNLSFFIDGLSLTFALMISGIGALILIYSGSYLKGHVHQGRFLAYISAFMGSMLGLVLADSMLVLFIFWELTSVTSFLLIGFDHSRQAARRAAIQALVITGGGGLALLGGVVLLQQLHGVWELSAVRGFGDAVTAHASYPLVLLLILAAAFTKSAQFPFHFWLPNAMEAPTPVSAFLHSATMVQAGVYLLSRLSPVLGGTPEWQFILPLFGGVTLLWGAFGALRETDLKQILAQTTIASLGLLVMLLGIGSHYAVAGMVAYFAAHALYKASLFMVAGSIDHGTGTRDITELGGLRAKMPLTFVAAALAGLSMFGAPLTLGFLAKEEMYLAITAGNWQALLTAAVMILGNALLGAAGLAVMIKPFFGTLSSTLHPHESGPSLLLGPILTAVVGVVLGVLAHQFGDLVLVPMGSVIANAELSNHLTFIPDPANPVFWLSVATWVLGLVAYFALDRLRTVLRRVSTGLGLSFDKGFDAIMFGLIRFAGAFTRKVHHGKLEYYLVVVFGLVAAALLLPLLALNAVPALPPFPDLMFYEWAIIGIAIVGLVSVAAARSRLTAIAALGIQGFSVAVIFILMGAPDLAFTQFMVEVLSVVIIALVMTRLSLDSRDPRFLEDILRDGGLALLCGAGVTILLLAVLANPLDMRLSEFFAATSQPLAHGRNIVNVILVDYRGVDTLGEISVVMTAGLAVLALIRRFRPRPASAVGPLEVTGLRPEVPTASVAAPEPATPATAMPEAAASPKPPRKPRSRAKPAAVEPPAPAAAAPKPAKPRARKPRTAPPKPSDRGTSDPETGGAPA